MTILNLVMPRNIIVPPIPADNDDEAPIPVPEVTEYLGVDEIQKSNTDIDVGHYKWRPR